MNKLSIPDTNNNNIELAYNDQFKTPNYYINPQQQQQSNNINSNLYSNLLNIKPYSFPYYNSYKNSNPVLYKMNSINPYNWPTQKILNNQAQTPITIIIQPQSTFVPPPPPHTPPPINPPPPPRPTITPPPPPPATTAQASPTQAASSIEKTSVETIVETTIRTVTHSVSTTGTSSESKTKSISTSSSQSSNAQKVKLPMGIVLFVLLQFII